MIIIGLMTFQKKYFLKVNLNGENFVKHNKKYDIENIIYVQ